MVTMSTILPVLAVIGCVLASTAHACSSKFAWWTTTASNAADHRRTQPCSPSYDGWYCVNDGKCFAVNFNASPIYSCECSAGYEGERCEYKSLDGSYAAAERRRAEPPEPVDENLRIGLMLVALLLLVAVALVCRVKSRRRRNATGRRARSDHRRRSAETGPPRESFVV